MTTQSERVLALIEKLGMTINAFENELGYSKGTVYLLKSRDNVSIAMVKRIAEHFPMVNTVWIMTGEGNMWKEDQQQVINISTGNGSSAGNGNTMTIHNERESSRKSAPLKDAQARISRLEETVNHLNEVIRQKDEIISLLKDKIAMLELNR